MPAKHRLDPALLDVVPTPLDAVVAALTRSGVAALDASQELLAHYSDTGDAPTQRAVDTLIEHAADALRAITDSLADLSSELQTAHPQDVSVQAITEHG